MADAAEKAKQRDIVAKQVEDLRKQERAIRNALPGLGQLKTLNEKLNKYNLTPDLLDKFIDENSKLERLGFTSSTAQILASELAAKSLDPQNAADALTSLLLQHKSLKETVDWRNSESRRLQQDIETDKTRLEGLRKRLSTLEQQVTERAL